MCPKQVSVGRRTIFLKAGQLDSLCVHSFFLVAHCMYCSSTPRSSIKELGAERRWASRGERRIGTATRRTGVRVALHGHHHACSTVRGIRVTRTACVSVKHACTCGFNASTNTNRRS